MVLTEHIFLVSEIIMSEKLAQRAAEVGAAQRYSEVSAAQRCVAQHCDKTVKLAQRSAA